MQAVERIAIALVNVERPGAERIGDTRWLAVAPLLQTGIAGDHLGWRRPYRPLPLVGNMAAARPVEAGPAYPNAITHGAAAFLHMIQEPVCCIDHDRSRNFRRDEID